MTSKTRKQSWRNVQFKKIYRGCEQNHGVVFKRYISRLIKLDSKRDEYIKSRLSYFERAVRARTDNTSVAKVATEFGLLYAGGMLARKFEIVDWSKGKILAALKKNYFATIGIMPRSKDETLDDGKRKLRAFLKKLPTRSKWKKSNIDAPGYKERGDDVTYIVMRDHLHRQFTTPTQRKLVIDWLLMTKQLKADYAWTTLARIMSFAKDHGIIDTNPCERGGRLYAADRTEKLWGESEIGALLSSAPAEIELALMLALWTGQRQGDLLRLPWSAYDGTHIRLRQSKTGRRLSMPVGQPLKVLLDRTNRRSTIVLANSFGRPWTSDGFRTSWAKACRKAGVTGLTFHDLRG